MKAFGLIKNMFKVIKIAIKNPYKYKVVDNAINGYSFDFGYLYELEYSKLKEMLNYFEKHGLSTDNDNIIRQIKLAMKLLNIIMEEEYKLFDFVYNPKPYNNEEEKVKLIKDMEYVCNVNVNLKNAKRFAIDGKHVDIFNRWPHELYLAKARYLYHKLRYNFEQYWWD